ncbi:MAG TPA: hypothetical protein VKU37_05660 [Verrucomicrobiae bacterium]|nr:hypothetical protein [Verrucomicrobiae bacterium]
MDIHGVLKMVGGIGVLVLFVPMAVEVLKRGGAGQSFATWILWATLDSILTVSTLQQHGNFLLPLGFALGGWVLTGLLLVKGRFAWGRLDSAILVFVFGCLAGWKLGGARTAIISATLAICLAGLPGLMELWRHPQRAVGNIWAGYVLANGLAFLGGTAMTVEERFAPAMFAAFAMLMFIASRKRITTQCQPGIIG